MPVPGQPPAQIIVPVPGVQVQVQPQETVYEQPLPPPYQQCLTLWKFQ